MTCPSSVRIARSEDRQELWRLSLQSHKENGLFPLDAYKVDWWFTRMIEPSSIPEGDAGPRGAIGVIGDVGKLEGMAILSFGTYWYTSQRHLEEFHVFVDQDCRKSGHAKALINWMKEQSNITRLPLLTGVISTPNTEAKIRLYERMIPRVGAFFMWKPESSNTIGT